MDSRLLVVIPSVPVWLEGNTYIFDRKYYDGVCNLVDHWPGDLRCVMRVKKRDKPRFGLVEKTKEQLPFDIVTLDSKKNITKSELYGARILMVSGDSFDNLSVSKLARKMNVSCVYNIEYIPETRIQIASLSTNNWFVRIRRYFYIWNGERMRRKAFSLSQGLQSNGMPAFNCYKKYKNNLLYFDTRVSSDQIISDTALDNRLANLDKKNELYLAFSGRLEKMKGADHLVPLAMKLKNRSIKFKLFIYGGGELTQSICEEIDELGLQNEVFYCGVADFYTELLPTLKEKIDVFVCLHRQSDPSCTYMETFSCGVPIVGYDNRAFRGILDNNDVGWSVSMNDVEGAADIIETLNSNREKIKEKSKNAVDLSRKHDFKSTFKKRVDQLISLAKLD